MKGKDNAHAKNESEWNGAEAGKGVGGGGPQQNAKLGGLLRVPGGWGVPVRNAGEIKAKHPVDRGKQGERGAQRARKKWIAPGMEKKLSS